MLQHLNYSNQISDFFCKKCVVLSVAKHNRYLFKFFYIYYLSVNSDISNDYNDAVHAALPWSMNSFALNSSYQFQIQILQNFFSQCINITARIHHKIWGNNTKECQGKTRHDFDQSIPWCCFTSCLSNLYLLWSATTCIYFTCSLCKSY